LYDAGARYVIQTEYLAAKSFRQVFEQEVEKPITEAFVEAGRQSLLETKKLLEGAEHAHA
jgi:hypothetical protein